MPVPTVIASAKVAFCVSPNPHRLLSINLATRLHLVARKGLRCRLSVGRRPPPICERELLSFCREDSWIAESTGYFVEANGKLVVESTGAGSLRYVLAGRMSTFCNGVLDRPLANRNDRNVREDGEAWQASQDFAHYRKMMRPGMLTGWFTDQIGGILQEFYEDLIAGKRPKLAIMAPPQHGKTTAAEDFASWLAGKAPQRRQHRRH